MRKTGLELSRVLTKEVTDAVLCRICKCLLDNPVECSVCNAGFCKLCINAWKAQHNSCPSNCPNSAIRKAHIIVRNMLDQLEVKCENYDYGCKEAIRYEVLKKHQKECEYKPVTCHYFKNGCTEKILAKNSKEHEENCSFKPFKCEKGCEQEILGKDLPTHSCISLLKGIITTSQNKIEEMLEEEKRMVCELYRARYRNVYYRCDKCKEEAMPGISYRCTVCNDFDFCSICMSLTKHPHKMEKIVPVVIYTRLIDSIQSEFDAKRLRINVTVLLKNYEATDQKIKFKTCVDNNITYLNNNHFEIKKNQQFTHNFAFLISKEKFEYIDFYIEKAGCARYFGIDFTIKLM